MTSTNDNWRMPMVSMVAIISLATVSGCSDETDSVAPEGEKVVTSEKQRHDSDAWLRLLDDQDPVDWLIEHENRVGIDVVEERRKEIETSLMRAKKLFGESPRMIVNRAVQLEAMLAEMGDRETAVDLIVTLTDSLSERGRIDGFGAYAQQYYSLRKQGLSGVESIGLLKSRYGARSIETNE